MRPYKRDKTAVRKAGYCLLLLLALLLASQMGCKQGVQSCASSRNCPAEEACVDQVCLKRECISSGDCQIQQYCDQVSGQCQNGCLDDSDCPYGDTCAAGQCQSRGCRNTNLDCQIGEFCDTTTGTCFKAAGPYCTPCVTADDCGGVDNRCYVGHCAPACSATQACPAGYDCVPFSNMGTIYSYNCITVCENVTNVPTSSAAARARTRPPSPPVDVIPRK